MTVRSRIARRLRSGLLGAALLALGACGTMQYQAGHEFDPALLETTLHTGVSTESDVRAALGEPSGTGGALLPFHSAPRTEWTYFYDRGSVDVGAGKVEDRRTYLFVFFDGGKLDSYMWFASMLGH